MARVFPVRGGPNRRIARSPALTSEASCSLGEILVHAGAESIVVTD